jgi:hypothetical protein
MVAQKGKDLLLKLDGDGSGNFVTVAGLRSKRLAFNSATVDVTDAESAGRWRELLAGSGVQNAAISARKPPGFTIAAAVRIHSSNISGGITWARLFRSSKLARSAGALKGGFMMAKSMELSARPAAARARTARDTSSQRTAARSAISP